MPTFRENVAAAEATGRPVAEGFAIQLKPDSGATQGAARTAVSAIAKPLGDTVWRVDDKGDGWFVFAPSDGSAIPLQDAWDAVRVIKSHENVEVAEPLLLTRVPVTNGADAQQQFKLWGVVSERRLAEIVAASGRDKMHWSLEKMKVRDAWTKWKAKPGNAGREPGDGVLVAHPDTGYTKHDRMTAILQRNGTERGMNFVERNPNGTPKPDAFDPMLDRAFLKFPGHGTSTASVIAAGNDDPAKPCGVAPGAKVLPLRVSSSVIHLSFQNVCDAFDEAIRKNADVISMSLGGPAGSALLYDRVEKALKKGIIIVAAAGNYAPTVMFPAKIPGVIACAASNALNRPWRFSGMGEEVVITAPGELVWHDNAITSTESNGNGTSFATAAVAGLAALWVSYWTRAHLLTMYGGDAGLIPFGFRHALEESSKLKKPLDFIKGGGFGTGIAQADALLDVVPSKVDAIKCRDEIMSHPTKKLISFPISSWWSIATLPTLTADGPVSVPDGDKRLRDLNRFVDDLFEKGHAPDQNDKAELAALAGTDIVLHNAFGKAARGARGDGFESAVRRYLLRDGSPLSAALRGKLTAARDAARAVWNEKHPELGDGSQPELGNVYVLPDEKKEARKAAYAIMPPPTRMLRAYAFDPSLTTNSDSVAVNEITIPVAFERNLAPGPVGDYLAVVDVDPASDCAYAPVDLNHPFILAQNGLPRSEGNPQFHQQMVYAVAMKTITHFEQALGRPIFWSPLRPWDDASGDKARAPVLPLRDENGAILNKPDGTPREDESDRFVQRLRIYPHALREQNAYYSPAKRAVLFGYFPAGDGDPGTEFPGGVVFTCLAHDIIAHEMTHAILDGMHVRFTEPTNPDVFAFHEAFSDIVALFERFTYPELLRDQIARARGRLSAGTLMTRIGLQFGNATGRHQALRDALGVVVKQARKGDGSGWRDVVPERPMDGSGETEVSLRDAVTSLNDEQVRYLWKRFEADPSLLASVEEPHERGSFLVAAVFDAYLRIYEDRIADLRRIATGGTGILPDGDLHPDLVNRMADEAAKSARHVLRMCIRAMDYVPPTDITFGEFLRALITADSDLVPEDDRRYRVAFIEAFRKWGIYPRDVRTLSEETLRWSPPDPVDKIILFPEDKDKLGRDAYRKVRRALIDWQPGEEREGIFDAIKEAQRKLHKYFEEEMPDDETKRCILGGIDTKLPFHVTNLRPARRIGPRGEFLTEMVVEVVQNATDRPVSDEEGDRVNGGVAQMPFRGGVTLIVSMDDYSVRYVIHKRVDSATRRARQRAFQLRAGKGGDSEAAEYSSQGLPAGWYTNPDRKKEWMDKRGYDPEAMRASSCACRRKNIEADEREAIAEAASQAGMAPPDALTEPFALLHRV